MHSLNQLARAFVSHQAFREQISSILLYSERLSEIKSRWEPWTDGRVSKHTGVWMYGSPTSFGATIDDLEMPETVSYILTSL